MSKTVNPSGDVTSFAPYLVPMTELEILPGRGPAGSVREQARADGHRRGFDAGYAEGHALGQAEGKAQFDALHSAAMEAFIGDLAAKVDEANAALEQWCADIERPMTELAVGIAARILAKELALAPEAILDITRAAIAEVTHATAARIKVNPFDVPMVSERKPELLAASSCLRSIEIVEDPGMLGGCVVETDGGSVDARIDDMLERARTIIRGGE